VNATVHHHFPGVLAGSARGDRGRRAGAGAPPVAAPGIIGQVASRLVRYENDCSYFCIRG